MGIMNLKWAMGYHHRTLKLVVFVILCVNMVMRLEGGAVENQECNVTMCGSTVIRFPFHLNDDTDDKNMDDHCVFPPGFQLSCIYQGFFAPMVEFKYQVNTSLPGLYLSFSVKAFVTSIDYKTRQLQFVTSPDYYYSTHFSSQNISQEYNYHSSNSPFKPFTSTVSPLTLQVYIPFSSMRHAFYFKDYTFYNCSSPGDDIFDPFNVIKYITSLSAHGYAVYAVPSHLSIVPFHLKSCTKMYNISDVPYDIGGLMWSQCYREGPPSHKLLLAGKVGGIFFILLASLALVYATHSYKQKKRYHLKVETFLEDYRALKPSRYSYADLKKISNQFTVKLGEGGYGSVFKGQLSNDVVVAIKVLHDKVDVEGSGEDFINEVSTIGLIHHVNVVRLVGYCADGCRKALVYEFLPNDSLEKYVYLRDNQNEKFLGWEKMQDIALGIAKGIEYLHQGCAQPILHFDIKPQNILLDQNFNPKVADFGLAKLCAKGQSIVSMTMARGTIGYIAPEVFSRNFGKVSSKSDVYSFGMLLLEMVGARDHISVGTEITSEAYFPEWVFHQLEQGRERRSQIEDEVYNNIEKKLTIVGLWCINWQPEDRPSMKHVIQMLQEEDCPAVPPNPFNSSSARNTSIFSNTLEAISESD